jgi:hypothetical protein
MLTIFRLPTSTLTRETVATIPTVGDALDALNALCGDLAHTLKQIVDLSAELAAQEHVSVDNIGEARGVYLCLPPPP